MVHRLQNRNTGYVDNSVSLNTTHQPTLNATVGATALDINTVIEKNNESEQKIEEQVVNEAISEPSLGNISMENAEYLQNTENELNEKKESFKFKIDNNLPPPPVVVGSNKPSKYKAKLSAFPIFVYHRYDPL